MEEYFSFIISLKDFWRWVWTEANTWHSSALFLKGCRCEDIPWREVYWLHKGTLTFPTQMNASQSKKPIDQTGFVMDRKPFTTLQIKTISVLVLSYYTTIKYFCLYLSYISLQRVEITLQSHVKKVTKIEMIESNYTFVCTMYIYTDLNTYRHIHM